MTSPAQPPGDGGREFLAISVITAGSLVALYFVLAFIAYLMPQPFL